MLCYTIYLKPVPTKYNRSCYVTLYISNQYPQSTTSHIMLYYKSKTSTHKVQQAMLCYTKYLKPVPQHTKGHVISHCISNQYHNVPKAMLYHTVSQTSTHKVQQATCQQETPAHLKFGRTSLCSGSGPPH